MSDKQEKPFPMPGTRWQYNGDPLPVGAFTVTCLRWDESCEVEFDSGDAHASLRSMKDDPDWQYLGDEDTAGKIAKYATATERARCLAIAAEARAEPGIGGAVFTCDDIAKRIKEGT